MLAGLPLANNKLQDVSLNLASLVKLQTLDLQGNYLQSLPRVLENLTALTDLNVSDNRLTGQVLLGMCGLEHGASFGISMRSRTQIFAVSRSLLLAGFVWKPYWSTKSNFHSHRWKFCGKGPEQLLSIAGNFQTFQEQ